MIIILTRLSRQAKRRKDPSCMRNRQSSIMTQMRKKMLLDSDPLIASLIKKESFRQQETLMLIPSENYVSPAAREALGSILTNKYSEGYPNKRYYQGNKFVDKIESLAEERAKKIFCVPHANVQAYSGSPANLAILASLVEGRGPILSQALPMGGHLSMGQKASITSRFFQAKYYGLTKEGEINWQELEKKAKQHRPQIIFCGGTAYTKILDFPRFSEIADKTGAFLIADISHVAGLVVGAVHPSPANFAHVIMTTTHKTLRGPRGAIIMVTHKGLAKDPELGKKINRSVFPGLQGGSHNNNIASIAAILKEAQSKSFKTYARQVVSNCQTLANQLIKLCFDLVGGGSENHMIWIDLSKRKIDGWVAAWVLEAAGMVVNRQTVPFELKPAYYPSGLRIGTPAVTTRGMNRKEMLKIADWFNQAIEIGETINLGAIGSADKVQDQKARGKFKRHIFDKKELLDIKNQVCELCQKFPVP